MNIFDDLIEELKEENLLENTVVKTNGSSKTVNNKSDETSANAVLNNDIITEIDNTESKVVEFKAPSFIEYSQQTKPSAGLNAPDANQKIISDAVIQNNRTKTEELKKPVNQVEFFRKRATDEVLALQMVENILAGIEREILNIVPKLYDELPVKMALHDFMQISDKLHSPEHAQSEFHLMQETESWYSALTHRDKIIRVGNLRSFCENSRPALSSQALIALARFYRNAPYSEAVRSKFDLILTRLFSKEVGGGKRILMLSRDKLIENISELYADWSSIPLYSADEDDSAIVLAAMKVEDFMTEADNAVTFEELIKNDFFNRLHVFKENTQDNFFAPLLTAAVIESNIRIGNRYTELFEKVNDDAEILEEKYGLMHEQTISEVICKTVTIKDFLNDQPVKLVKSLPKKNVSSQTEPTNAENPKAEIGRKKSKIENKFFKVNKWLLALTIITLLATSGLYFWVESVSNELIVSTNVKNVNLDNSVLKDYIQTARISSDTFYGIVLPSWDALPRDKKEEFLSQVMLLGSEKEFSRVNLINRQGKTVGFASPERVEVSNP